MTCSENHCAGTISETICVHLHIGCTTKRPAYPCLSCRRLHWGDGKAVNNRQGHAAFWVDGQVVHKDDEGRVVGGV
jgi:hypothetical protein